MKVRNIFIIFLVSGFWHGANWAFVAWGGLDALFFLPLLLTKRNRNHVDVIAKGAYFPSFIELVKVLSTFALTVFAWIFFRASNMQHAFDYIAGIFSSTIIEKPHFKNMLGAYITLGLIAVFMVIEWLGRSQRHALENISLKVNKPLRYAFYYTLIITIIWFMDKEQEFIYFQF